MRLIILLVAAFLAGCSLNAEYKGEFKSAYSKITVVEDPNLPTLGQAKWDGDQCTITLRKYPICLAHEVRHCLEGYFHGHNTSNSNCYSDN